jgi:hypothetical protein
MATDKSSLYEDSVALLERINQELKDNKYLSTINVKLVQVIKDINEVRLSQITGKESAEDERK